MFHRVVNTLLNRGHRNKSLHTCCNHPLWIHDVRTVALEENCSQDNCSSTILPGMITHRIIASRTVFSRIIVSRMIAPKIIAPEHLPLDNCPRGKLPFVRFRNSMNRLVKLSNILITIRNVLQYLILFLPIKTKFLYLFFQLSKL